MSSHPPWLKTNSSLLLSRKTFPLSYSQRIQRKLSNKRSDSARRKARILFDLHGFSPHCFEVSKPGDSQSWPPN
jgi:hypothetical protein